jgi:hypothetical protein
VFRIRFIPQSDFLRHKNGPAFGIEDKVIGELGSGVYVRTDLGDELIEQEIDVRG